MADLLAIKNYVMLFINDQADFMAEQAMQYHANLWCRWWLEIGAETGPETGSEDGSETGAEAGSETGVVDGSDYG